MSFNNPNTHMRALVSIGHLKICHMATDVVSDVSLGNQPPERPLTHHCKRFHREYPKAHASA